MLAEEYLGLRPTTPYHKYITLEEKKSFAEDVVLRCRRILCICSWFRTGEAVEQYCYRGKRGGGGGYINKKYNKRIEKPWPACYDTQSVSLMPICFI